MLEGFVLDLSHFQSNCTFPTISKLILVKLYYLFKFVFPFFCFWWHFISSNVISISRIFGASTREKSARYSWASFEQFIFDFMQKIFSEYPINMYMHEKAMQNENACNNVVSGRARSWSLQANVMTLQNLWQRTPLWHSHVWFGKLAKLLPLNLLGRARGAIRSPNAHEIAHGFSLRTIDDISLALNVCCKKTTTKCLWASYI